MKLIIAYKNPKADNPSACHIGLGNTSANTAEVLTEHGIDAEAVPYVDGYWLRAAIQQNKWPGLTHVVFAAPTIDTPFMRSLVDQFPRIKFAVCFHSNVAFLGVDNWSTKVLPEEIALERQVGNFSVAANSAKFCNAVMHTFDGAPCALLPNLYYIDGPVQRQRAVFNGNETLKIGAFGATRVLKNFVTAAWAAATIANSLRVPTEFHVSAGREEGAGSNTVIKNIQYVFADQRFIKLIHSPWANWMDFRRTIRRMHLLMQPSFTESWNGVTADGIAEGVPSVVSPAIDWTPANWSANPDDAVAVAAVGQRLILSKSAVSDGYKSLVRHNEAALRAWKRYLGIVR